MIKVCFFFALSPSVAADAQPIVIAHRGASGYLPEHMLFDDVKVDGLFTDFPDVVVKWLDERAGR